MVRPDASIAAASASVGRECRVPAFARIHDPPVMNAPRHPTEADLPTPPANEKARLDFEAGLEPNGRNGSQLQMPF